MTTGADQILAALARSKFRSRFRLGEKERAYLNTRGLDTVLEHGREFIAQRLQPADPANDGKQTPMRGHPVFVAQHATATCCRGCLQTWHGIPAGKELDEAACGYVLAVLRCWLEKQQSRL